jgi:hypothetical protein
VLDHFPRAFDPTPLLSGFFKNPVQFRALMASTGACLSCSFALAVLQRRRELWHGSGLEVYVNMHGFERILRWLVDEGYEYQPQAYFHVPWNALERALRETRDTGEQSDMRAWIKTQSDNFDPQHQAFEELWRTQERPVSTYDHENPEIEVVFRFKNKDGKKVEVVVFTNSALEAILGVHCSK